MAYQPIQMPTETPMLRAMSDLGSSLGELGQQGAQQRHNEELRKRQEQQDFQAALLQAKKLADGGDMAGAHAIMAPYKAKLEQQAAASQSEGMPPPPPPMPAAPPKPPQGGSPLPDSMEFGNNPASDFDMDHGQLPSQLPSQAPGSMPPSPPPALPEPIEPPPNPVMAARQAQLAQQQQGNQQRARTVLKFTGPGGVAGSIDPEASRTKALEQRSQRLDSAFAGIEDPEMKEMYQRIRPVLLSSNQDVDPTDVFKFMQSASAEKQRAASEEARYKEGLRREDARDKEWDRRNAVTDPQKNARAALAAGTRNAAVRQGDERLDLSKETQARGIVKDVFSQVGFREEQAKNKRFNDLAKQIAQPNAALDAATAGIWVKQAQGGSGVISDSDMNAFWNRIGSVKDKSAQWVESVMSGKIESGRRAIVSDAVRWLAGQARSNLDQVKKSVHYGLQHSTVPEFTDALVGTYFPEERPKIEDAHAIERARNRTRAGRVKGGGKDALDGDLDKLR